MKPYLLFEFSDLDGESDPHFFQNPDKIYQTTILEEVPSIFKNIEKELDKGYYIAGYVSYEAAPAFEKRFSVHSNPKLPLVWFGVFKEPIKQAFNRDAQPFHVSNWALDASFSEYQDGISAIKQAIEEGDTYQINYTSRLHATFDGDDYSFYKQLSGNQQASYSAYLNIGRFRILSASPELFFQVSNQTITTKPMKGTAKRGRYLKQDRAFKNHLWTSEKEQAENLMIVDLLRNDLGKIAKPGTVRVPNLFDIETYPTVHQMTSTIQAELKENTSIYNWFEALFPCGSITGAPKIKTMDYIKELEHSPREVYCGAIGYITPEREAIFNVPIRTVVIDSEDNRATYGVGGGVTWDSTATGEYDELFTKAQLLTAKQLEFELLESIALINGKYPLKQYHLRRLQDSAIYFNFSINQEAIEKDLRNAARRNPTGTFKLRLTVTRDGNTSVTTKEIKPINEPVRCSIAKAPVDSQYTFLYHKTTNRAVYKLHENQKPKDVFSVLLWNENDELTEFTIGNLVVEVDGQYYTPPLESGLLPGTYRQQLLDEGTISEKILKKEDLHTYDSIWFVNSVRGWLQVEISF